MSVFLDDYFLYASLSGSMIDLTPDAIKKSLVAEWGINDNTSKSILADTGSLSFTLNNKDGKYTPGSTGLAGWKRGVSIELILYFEGESYKRFTGFVDSLKPNDEDFTMDVTVVDWMDYSAKYPLTLPETLQNQTADQGLEVITNAMPIPPKNTDFDIGDSIFPVLLDEVSRKTKAYTEFDHIALSEPGYIYLKKDKVYGETLAFENKSHRTGLRTLDIIPKSKLDSSRVMNSSGGLILNSTGGTILVRQSENAVFDNTMNDIELSYDQGIVNSISVSGHPKTFDTTNQILYHINSPIQILPWKTIEFYGQYTDSGSKVCSVLTSTMIPPVRGTDMLFNSSPSGGGSDLVWKLEGIALYGSSEVKYTLSNLGNITGYVLRLNARGKGIHNGDILTASAESQASIDNYGYQTEEIDQTYQPDVIVGKSWIASIVELEKKPRTSILSANFIANSSDKLMMAFLNLDIGNLVQIIDDRYNINGWYYVQKFKFEIELGGIITFSLGLRRSYSLNSGLSMTTNTFSASSTDAISYGTPPQLIDLPVMTLSSWIFPTNNDWGDVMSAWLDTFGGFELKIELGKIGLTRVHTGGGGIWTSDNTCTLNAWNFITVSVDSTTAAPKMYINGVESPVTTVTAPIGNLGSIDGDIDFMIGNIHGQSVSTQYKRPFIGSIKDPRVYNRALLSSEVASLNAGGVVTDGLKFQGGCIRTDEINDYQGTLTSETKLLDNIYSQIGTASGSVVCSIP